MEKAIDVLTAKRDEWLARGEYHRKAMMEAHVEGRESDKERESQMTELARDNIVGLEYAISLLWSYRQQVLTKLVRYDKIKITTKPERSKYYG